MTKQVTVNVPTTLEQKLFGTPLTVDVPISRKQLQSIFYVGRKLQLIACLIPMKEPKPRIVKAHKSYGYILEMPEGRDSHLRFETGDKIYGISEYGQKSQRTTSCCKTF